MASSSAECSVWTASPRNSPAGGYCGLVKDWSDEPMSPWTMCMFPCANDPESRMLIYFSVLVMDYVVR